MKIIKFRAMQTFVCAIIFMIGFNAPSYAQTVEHDNYLIEHRIDLRTHDAGIDRNILGMTVIHGSSKTEEAEMALIKSVLAHTDTLNYFPEIDAAMAYYFTSYLKTGDETLLKDLILTYENRVPQEAGVAMFDKWREFRRVAVGKHVAIWGIDIPVSYKYYAKLLSELGCDSLDVYLHEPDTDYSVGKDTPLANVLQSLVCQYRDKKLCLNKQSKDPLLLEYLMNNIDNSLNGRARRDSVMADNYTFLNNYYKFDLSKQFFRMGVFHMMKERFENTPPGLVATLIQNGTWSSADIYVIQCFLYHSKVLWQRVYNDKGEYSGYTEEGGFYAGENLPGVQTMADNSVSDLTFFDLSGKDSPLRLISGLDLGGLKLLPDKSLSNYVDGAVLIKDSKANTPIEALK